MNISFRANELTWFALNILEEEPLEASGSGLCSSTQSRIVGDLIAASARPTPAAGAHPTRHLSAPKIGIPAHFRPSC
jgi:hypothetical protein